MSDRLDAIRLARAEGVGPVTYRKLLVLHGDAAAALASRERGVPSRDAIEREQDALQRRGGRFLLLDEPDYPPLLAALADAPPAVSFIGDLAKLRARSVAVVGARNASANGRRFAETIAAELALAGFVVVSGLARGIDTAAHRGALGVGMTVAAVAGGLDRPYPPENATLQDAIVDAGGAVIAEQPLGTVPTNRHFPRRNRIIAGLSAGCVVVEAALHSGSLITASIAQDAGRELFAVPGWPLDPRSRGSNDLLRQGAAHLCEGVADVLAELSPSLPSRPPYVRPKRSTLARPVIDAKPDATAATADPVSVADILLGLLGPTPTPLDELVRSTPFSPAMVAAALSELELSGQIEMLPGSRVCLPATGRR